MSAGNNKFVPESAFAYGLVNLQVLLLSLLIHFLIFLPYDEDKVRTISYLAVITDKVEVSDQIKGNLSLLI